MREPAIRKSFALLVLIETGVVVFKAGSAPFASKIVLVFAPLMPNAMASKKPAPPFVNVMTSLESALAATADHNSSLLPVVIARRVQVRPAVSVMPDEPSAPPFLVTTIMITRLVPVVVSVGAAVVTPLAVAEPSSAVLFVPPPAATGTGGRGVNN